MKVADLTGALLDYWVARAEGHEKAALQSVFGLPAACYRRLGEWETGAFQPSTSWEQGGPIIERENIDLSFQPTYGYVAANIFKHGPGLGDVDLTGQADGPTPLVAAMRAYVASKIGEDVPDQTT